MGTSDIEKLMEWSEKKQTSCELRGINGKKRVGDNEYRRVPETWFTREGKIGMRASTKLKSKRKIKLS